MVELPSLVAGTRCRKSCYFDATVRWGVRGFTTYNHMLLPTCFSGAEDEYWSLRNDVCLWDVAVERQVELVGPDALRLAEMLTPRAIASMKVGDCRYAVLTNDDGMVLNDPVVLRLAEDRFWFSISDSDVLLWIQAIALCQKLDVRVFEAAVSPCAVQGPKSLDLIRDLVGDWVSELKYFTFRETEIDGIRFVLSRSGWSPELGYELFLLDESRGVELWERIMQKGKRYGIKPGVPNQIRRIEGGMLSYGADVTKSHTYLSMGLPPKWMKLDKPDGFFGQAALERIVADGGPEKRIVGVKMTCEESIETVMIRPWSVEVAGAGQVGELTSVCFSPMFDVNIGIATITSASAQVGTEVHVNTHDGPRQGIICNLPFAPRIL